MLEFDCVNQKSVKFPDEKEMNLDRADGLSHHWHELKHELAGVNLRHQGGHSVRSWGVTCGLGTFLLEGLDGV